MSLVAPDPGGHLDLVQNLLSPASTPLPSTTPTAISVQLATLSIDSDALTSFVRILLTSPSLWRGSASSPPFGRSQEVFTAVLRGFLLRVDNVKEELNYGWRARRHLGHVLDAMLAGCEQQIPPIFRLLFTSAILNALQTIYARHDMLYVGGSNLLGRTEDVVLGIWAEMLQQTEDLSSPDGFTLPCWLLIRTLTAVESAKLSVLPIRVCSMQQLGDQGLDMTLQLFLDMTLNALCECFADGRLFDHMQDDCTETEEGLMWTNPSPSRSLLQSLRDRPLFGELGRLSQVVGKAIESVTTREALETVHDHLQRLERLAERINKGWLALKWSEFDDETDLAPALRDDAAASLPWSILKTFLFSLTMIHSSLVSLLTSVPTDAPSELSLDLSASSIRSFGWLYFVTSRFGYDGFGAYKGAWYGALDLINRAVDAGRIEALARNIEPKRSRGDTHAATYYFNVLEQIIENIPDTYLEEIALPIARRYMSDARYPDAFEAAHTVVLAVFSNAKRSCDALAPWYTTLLLKVFPEHLNAPQLRLAYTTVTKQCSESSDALAWLCVQKLLAAIDAIPLDAEISSKTSGGQADLSSLHRPPRPHKDVRQDEGRPQDHAEQRDDSPLTGARITALESRALQLPRGALLLVLIDLLGALNLTLLLPALEALEALLAREPAGDPRKALVRCLLAALANMDAAKRVPAVRWWQVHGPKLWMTSEPGRIAIIDSDPEEAVEIVGETGRSDRQDPVTDVLLPSTLK